jgi:hypothetical protein
MRGRFTTSTTAMLVRWARAVLRRRRAESPGGARSSSTRVLNPNQADRVSSIARAPESGWAKKDSNLQPTD